MCKFPEELLSVGWNENIDVPVSGKDGLDQYDKDGNLITEQMSIWDYVYREFEKIGGYPQLVITEDGEVIDVPAPQLGLPDSIDDVLRVPDAVEEKYGNILTIFENLILYNRPDLVAELTTHSASDSYGVGIMLDRFIEGEDFVRSDNHIQGGLLSLYIVERDGVERDGVDHMVFGIPVNLVYKNNDRPRSKYLGVMNVDVELQQAIDSFSKYGDNYFWEMLGWLNSGRMNGGYVFFMLDWKENAEINEILKELREMTKAGGGEITKEEVEKLMTKILYSRMFVAYRPINEQLTPNK